MELKLKVLDGKHAGQDVPVHGDKFFIGRAEDCQLRPGSDLVSRHHCVIMVDDGYVGVRDLGSKNGTFVNAERIIGERPLQAGDRVKVGPLEFEVVLSTGVGGKKRPAVTGGVKEAASRAASTMPDVDVSQWLTPESGGNEAGIGPSDTGRLTVASSDTEEIDLGSTKELAMPGQSGVAADATRIDPPEADVKKPDPKAKKEPGKLPMSARLMAKDSRDAAAKVLEMMKKRR